MSGGNGKHQPGDETRLSKVLIPTELAAFGSLSIQDQIVSVPSRPVGPPDGARKEQVMIKGVINRRFSWALALAAAVVATLALVGVAQAATTIAVAGDGATETKVGDGQVELVWTGEPETGAVSIQYRWENTLNQNSGWQTIPGRPAIVKNHVVTGLQNGIQYTFTLREINAAGEMVGDVSNALLVVPSSMADKPDPPLVTGDDPATTSVTEDLGAAVLPGTTNILVQWGRVAGATGYEYQWFVGDTAPGEGSADWRGPVKVGRSTQTTLRDLQRHTATTIQFEVRALKGSTPSDWSGDFNVELLAYTADEALDIEDFMAEASDRGVKLKWNVPDTTAAVGSVRIEVRYRDVKRPAWRSWQRLYSNIRPATSVIDDDTGDDAASKPYSRTITGLSNGVTYDFEIRANHATRAAGETQMASATPVASAAKPAGLVAVANDGFVTLYIDDPNPSDTKTSFHYEVWQSPGYLGQTSGADDWSVYDFRERIGDPTRLSASVFDLENDRSYTFRVRALGGETAYSEVRVTPSATPGEEPDPRAGFTLSATAGASQVMLEWTKQSDVGGFEYRMDLTKEVWLVVPGSNSDTTAYVKSGLTDGDEVSFQVRSTKDMNDPATDDRSDDTEIKRSSVVSVTVGLDRTAPDTMFTSMPEMMTESTTAEFVISSSEEGSTFECSLDSAPFAACTSPHMLTELELGSHTFRARATDMADNIDRTAASYTWTVTDTVAPETTITSGPAMETLDMEATFEFESNEAGVTFWCSLDGATSTACTSPVTETVAIGSHTFEVTALDAAGNTDASPASYTWTVTDTVAPETTITSGPAMETLDMEATFEFESNEAGVTFWCSLDGATSTACTSPVTETVAIGSHTFEVTALDAAGNTDASPASYTWTVTDTVAPETTITSGPAMETLDMEATFEFESNEAGVTFWCSLDGATSTACTSPVTETVAIGSHTFEVTALDAAGNTDASPASYTWTVTDTVAPETTITSGPAMETLDMEATFEFESNEAGVTFWCSLDGATSTACTSPVTETVAIGSHTFEVTALDAAGNTDASPASYTWTVTAPVVEPVEPEPRDDGCTIWGTEGDDILTGTPGDDVICGLGGNDTIRGGQGNDVIRGGAGDDILIGGAGNDTLRGGSGNDRLIGKAGNDMLFGEVGDDTLRGNAGDDMLRGGPGSDMLYGGSGDDMLYGGSGDDVLRGEAGDDMLVGGKGKDTLRGGSGNNTLRGR